MTPEVKERIEQIRHGNVPEGYKKTKSGIVPEDWTEYTIGECLERVERPVDVRVDEMYTQIGIRSHGKGLFYKEPVTGASLGNKAVYWVEPDCFVLNIVFAWEQAVSKTTQNEVGMIGSHRFPMYRPIDGRVDVDYLITYMLTKRGKDILEAASPGGAGRNRTLGQDRFMKSKIILPSAEEQRRIANVLTTQNRTIELKEKLLVEKRQQKKYLMQQLLAGKKYLTVEGKSRKKYSFSDIFTTISSKAYQIQSSEYLHEGKFPVVDQGKRKIAGFCDDEQKVLKCPNEGVIVFGDHTRELKFIDFDFIVGADGTQLLLSRTENVSTKYLYYLLCNKAIPNDGYSRHFKYLKEFIYLVPCEEEQAHIVKVLSSIDREIELLYKDLEQEKQKKKALMQLLLTGIVRVNA